MNPIYYCAFLLPAVKTGAAESAKAEDIAANESMSEWKPSSPSMAAASNGLP